MKTAAVLIAIAVALISGSGARADEVASGISIMPDNHCSGWAVLTGKEGVVRDSASMHRLGCDDGPYANARYRADFGGEGCSYTARAIVRSNPYYYAFRPRTVSNMVIAKKPWCTVFEDGSYEDNSTH